ncbi:uncharacterized protein LOC132912822 [Bombus pascuorum]|uniref:uncharacterized protein LOC132912822 n=1 Tax=Bombus pascuorum TaxID=65598 RepID=UPI002138A7E0|nr:uncharacterized protein LOC132912822 [Bombus pascuorum]
MDELAITPEPIRKRARIGNKCDAQTVVPTSFSIARIASLPVEIILQIFSYLSCKELYVVSQVSVLFNRLAYDPFLWRTYEVTSNEQDTAEVIKELKRMPLLKKFSISVRPDCDEILRQLSLTNKNLEELHISNCTGSTSKLYLRSGYLIRILERCRNLHTINILGSRFRGQKFYQLLGDMGPQLRSVYAPATKSQFYTFIKFAKQISETDRLTIASMFYINTKSWAPLYYFVTKGADRVCTALISYLHNDILLSDANRSIHKLSITERRNT